jgi:hypothetical protein
LTPTVIDRLLDWLLWTAFASLIPLGIDYLVRLLTNKPTSLTDMIGQGQLMLIGVAIAVPSFGVLLSTPALAQTPSDQAQRGRKLVGAGLFFGVLFMVVVYVCASVEVAGLDEEFVAQASVFLFSSALLFSAACLAFSSESR